MVVWGRAKPQAAERVREVASGGAVMGSAYFFIPNALAEELFFRGLVQTALIRLVRNRVVGLLAASLIFGLYHIPMFGWSLPSALISSAGGVVFGFAFLRRRSIVTAWFLHGLADLALLKETLGTYLLASLFA